MDEEAPIDFKALRAKFQEEGLLAHLKSARPSVAEKPKLIQPFLGHLSSVVTGIATAVENHTPEAPCVLFRDGLRSSGGKRPVSFPPHSKQTSPPSQLANGGMYGSGMYVLKDQRHMPLVLPALPFKDQKVDAPESESVKAVFPHTKIKKKGLLLPFKSVKQSKNSADNGEEPAYGDLPNRPPSGISLVGKQSSEERASLLSDQSTSEYPVSSPEFTITPPPPETYPDPDNRILSTLDKAKKKLSLQPIVIPPKPKGLGSPDYSCSERLFPLSPKNPNRLGSDSPSPPPVCLPHLACISARPFVKANNSAWKQEFAKNFKMEKVSQPPVRTVECNSTGVPLIKPLAELWMLGPAPVKPPRPPITDFSSYHAVPGKEASPGRCQIPNKEEGPVLDAPDFPDFEASELEIKGEPVDVAALETEMFGVVVGNAAAPIGYEATEYEAPDSALSACDPADSIWSQAVQDLNLGSPHIIPLDPGSFPEPINLPEFPEAAADAYLNSCPDDAGVAVAKSLSVLEVTETMGPSASNSEAPMQPSKHHQNSYYETWDNVYEDVEINKLGGQISLKQKMRLKNPYAESQSKKVEPCLHRRPRHPWPNASPNTADHKEQRKREKQRLEKERKERKEREKKENEMKKKFKVTGEEEPVYQAKVTVASKVRKNDLPVRNGDTVSIIRTTNCPKGKWLARDANHKYGYISVMNVELNIKDMLELGKKAQAAGRGAVVELDTISIGSRSSNPPLQTSSFTDDSEEWACVDEPLSPFYESRMRHEAVQNLAALVQHSQDESGDGGAALINADTSSFLSSVEEPPYPEQEIDFTEVELLPPPPLYADHL